MNAYKMTGTQCAVRVFFESGECGSYIFPCDQSCVFALSVYTNSITSSSHLMRRLFFPRVSKGEMLIMFAGGGFGVNVRVNL